MSIFRPPAAADLPQGSAVQARPAEVQLFQTESVAGASFPGETIVWINTETAAIAAVGPGTATRATAVTPASAMPNFKRVRFGA